MVLKKRIIPCLDIDGGRVVKGVNFVGIRDAGDPLELALRYRDDGADEIVFLDITASAQNRRILIEVVHRIGHELDIPFTVGGGIRSYDDAREILNAGADKVSVNTAAILDEGLIQRLADRFGRQCVVVAIDTKLNEEKQSYEVFSHGGRMNTGVDCVEWAIEVASLGGGEILLTSMDRDGTKIGFDSSLTSRVSEAVEIPVIASGGAGTPNDFVDVFTNGNADAALAASIFHYGQYTIRELKEYLQYRGVEVRL